MVWGSKIREGKSEGHFPGEENVAERSAKAAVRGLRRHILQSFTFFATTSQASNR